MPRKKSSSSIAITSFDVMSISTNKNKEKHHHQHPSISTSLLLSDLLKNYNTHYVENEVTSTATFAIDNFKIIEPYNPPSLYYHQTLKRKLLSTTYTSRELRVNPDYLRMLVAEANMVRANKITGSLRPRHYLPKRQDLICFSPTPLRQEL